MAGEVTILVVDDQADPFERRVRLLPAPLRDGVVVRHPEEVTIEDVDRAKLVLVDDCRLKFGDHVVECARRSEPVSKRVEQRCVVARGQGLQPLVLAGSATVEGRYG